MNHKYLSDASVILGIIAIIVCLFGDVLEPFRTVTIITMPIILIVNYYALMELEAHKH